MTTIELDDPTAAALTTRARLLGLDVQAFLKSVAGVPSQPANPPSGDLAAELDAFLATQPPGPPLSASALTRADFYEQ